METLYGWTSSLPNFLKLKDQFKNPKISSIYSSLFPNKSFRKFYTLRRESQFWRVKIELLLVMSFIPPKTGTNILANFKRQLLKTTD